ncbi:hypothetical protein F5B18DRAFT_399435 [Nemania serpens]|nr:hypothetical protein F5B18DRAFT_399435 [Nemania serpens]
MRRCSFRCCELGCLVEAPTLVYGREVTDTQHPSRDRINHIRPAVGFFARCHAQQSDTYVLLARDGLVSLFGLRDRSASFYPRPVPGQFTSVLFSPDELRSWLWLVLVYTSLKLSGLVSNTNFSDYCSCCILVSSTNLCRSLKYLSLEASVNLLTRCQKPSGIGAWWDIVKWIEQETILSCSSANSR